MTRRSPAKRAGPEILKERARQAEIIDRADFTHWDEVVCVLDELRLVNRWLGGVRACQTGLGRLLRRWPRLESDRPLRLMDFGCGSADISAALVKWARRQGRSFRVVAADLNLTVCQYAAQSVRRHPEIQVVQADVHHPPLRAGSCDIVLFAAFLHHFSNRQIADIIANLVHGRQASIVISDLHRHWLACWSIRLLTALFSRSAAVGHDGPLSVRKGFRKSDLEDILAAANIRQAWIRWRWAFRWVVVIEAPEVGATTA